MRAKEIAAASAGNSPAVTRPDEVDLNPLSLFDTVKEDDILEELKSLDLGSMTPIDALNTLYRMQTKLNNRWQSN